jgi:8-oxo-dGTP pyrophosphatase MutT (NUDIX family)
LYHPNGSGRFLTLIRSDTLANRAGELDLPGGNVEYGEDGIASILREVSEETGLNVLSKPKIYHTIARMNEKKGYYIIAHAYTSKLNDNQLSSITLSGEHASYEWLTKEEFETRIDHQFLNEMVQHL